MSPQTPTPQPRGFATQPQPKLAPKEPGTRQEAAKEAFLDVIYNGKSMALELIDDFRASDRFFKYKAGVLGGWVLLSFVALFVACPGDRSQMPSNSLDARVMVQQVPALDRRITAIYIENGSDEDWGDTLIKLNGTFSHALADLKAGAKAVVTVDKFSGPGGSTPPPGLTPQKLEISCREGRTTIDLLELHERQKRQ